MKRVELLKSLIAQFEAEDAVDNILAVDNKKQLTPGDIATFITHTAEQIDHGKTMPSETAYIKAAEITFDKCLPTGLTPELISDLAEYRDKFGSGFAYATEHILHDKLRASKEDCMAELSVGTVDGTFTVAIDSLAIHPLNCEVHQGTVTFTPRCTDNMETTNKALTSLWDSNYGR